MLYWSIFMIIICYAHLISMARISKNPVVSMSNLTDNSMDHSLYLPKQYLTPCQSQQQSTMRHLLSHCWLNYNFRTKAATEDLHHHHKCRSKGMITLSVVRTVWKQRYTPKKQKIWASFHKPRRFCCSKMYEQTNRVQCRTNWKG